jgi:hypothetical protein
MPAASPGSGFAAAKWMTLLFLDDGQYGDAAAYSLLVVFSVYGPN